MLFGIYDDPHSRAIYDYLDRSHKEIAEVLDRL